MCAMSFATSRKASRTGCAPTIHREQGQRAGPLWYPRRLASHTDITMIETNPIHAQIADLRERVESLRGYL